MSAAYISPLQTAIFGRPALIASVMLGVMRRKPHMLCYVPSSITFPSVLFVDLSHHCTMLITATIIIAVNITAPIIIMRLS